MKWYYVIIEERTRKHRCPSNDKATANKWAQFYNLESELKGLDRQAWVESVELEEGDDIAEYLRDADEDYYQSVMDGYFDWD